MVNSDLMAVLQSDLFSETFTGNHTYLGAYDRVIDRFYQSYRINGGRWLKLYELA